MSDDATDDATLALMLAATDPTLGVVLRTGPGPARDAWLARLSLCLPGVPFRRVPASIGDERLLGGLDLAATLQSGRPVMDRGVLAETAGGVLLLAMAERIPPGTAARIGAAQDRSPFGIVALDEGLEDEAPPITLRDRLALYVELDPRWTDAEWVEDGFGAARALLPGVTIGDDVIEALCAATVALGIGSARAACLATAAARASAALDGRLAVNGDDATLAARLVLGPRATILPAASPEPAPADNADAPGESEAEPENETETETEIQPMADTVQDAAIAAIPAGLLAQLTAQSAPRASVAGTSGALRTGLRGRPAGVRAGDPRRGERLNLIETLRAAAPWQLLRQRTDRIQIRRDDFRVSRLTQRAQTTTIFLVDASGSQALNRLAEAKGAVELLLAESYVRRDQVALISFRGKTAELLLPPTRSLVRAKRCLAGLPGGGGTPLATGLDAGLALADGVRRRGGTPTLVLLTDGRGNVARNGLGGRPRAEADATDAARAIRAAKIDAVLIDSALRPHPASRALAQSMDARYVALPYANAASVSQAVRR